MEFILYGKRWCNWKFVKIVILKVMTILSPFLYLINVEGIDWVRLLIETLILSCFALG